MYNLYHVIKNEWPNGTYSGGITDDKTADFRPDSSDLFKMSLISFQTKPNVVYKRMNKFFLVEHGKPLTDNVIVSNVSN